LWLNLERTADKRGRTAKKSHHFAEGDYKKGRQFVFQETIGVTPSVAAPGVTHPSDATAIAYSEPLRVSDGLG